MLPLHGDSVQEWFRELARRLGRAYRFHLAGRTRSNDIVLVFWSEQEGVAHSLRLYEVAPGARYAIALCRDYYDGPVRKRGCLYIWNLIDPRQPAQLQIFCAECVRVHPDGEHPPYPSIEASAEHLWDHEAADPGQFVETLLNEIIAYVHTNLSGFIVSA